MPFSGGFALRQAMRPGRATHGLILNQLLVGAAPPTGGWGASWFRRPAYPWGEAASKWRAVSWRLFMLVLAQVTWVDFGEIERIHNDADFSGTVSPHFEAILRTNDAGVLARARLFNVTLNQAVSGSIIGTISTTPIRIRSGALLLPAGENLYKAQFGA